MVVLCYLLPPWQNLVLIVYHQALLAKTIHYREFKNISVLTSSCEINIMKIITQSQGTLWNIYLKLLYQGLETDDQNSPLMTIVQDYCNREGSEGKGEKRRYQPAYIVPWQLFIWMSFSLNVFYSAFSPWKCWKWGRNWFNDFLRNQRNYHVVWSHPVAKMSNAFPFRVLA